MSKKDHPICIKEDNWHYETMNRLYTRDKNKFVPIGWICNSCKRVIFDWTIRQYVEQNKDDFEKSDGYRWWKRIEFDGLRITNPMAYIES